MKRKYAVDFYKAFSSSYDEEWAHSKSDTPIPTPDASGDEGTYRDISVSNYGQYQENDSYNEIWDNLLEDCETDADTELITKLRNLSSGQLIDKPNYGATVYIGEIDKSISVDELWTNKKVMLFLSENEDEYRIAKQTNWTCYCTSVGFDPEELIDHIRR
jgi:hypothetical protein